MAVIGTARVAGLGTDLLLRRSWTSFGSSRTGLLSRGIVTLVLAAGRGSSLAAVE